MYSLARTSSETLVFNSYEKEGKKWETIKKISWGKGKLLKTWNCISLTTLCSLFAM